MAGLEKIISQIRHEAEEKGERMIAAAEKDAEQMLETAREEALAVCGEIEKKSERDVANTLERGRSAADLKLRQGILARKQRLIDEILTEAREAVNHMEPELYFQAMVRLAVRSAMAGDGTVTFSETDLRRLPEGLEERMNAALEIPDASLHISDIPGKLDGGFILSYGEIEENCSIEALFDSERERLKDLVQEILFT
ncbi:MAG TPA: V-type ATP synthase subunit E [Firmicutes bacterium]|nr:V-type ATP synthase subunit E [Bacillota bacterium]